VEGIFEELRKVPFDSVLLLDVLEHLRDPEGLLALCRTVLMPSGSVIVSVPNVANLIVRLSLLVGRFDYADRGILDRTHLRFFTRKSARRLLQQAGFEITDSVTTNVPLERILGLSPSGKLMRFLDRLLALATAVLPGLLGYQVMFKARASSPGESGDARRAKCAEAAA